MPPFHVVKKNKRVWIVDIETNEGVYALPDFMKPLQSREPMHDLASAFNDAGRYDINPVIELESRQTKRKKPS